MPRSPGSTRRSAGARHGACDDRGAAAARRGAGQGEGSVSDGAPGPLLLPPLPPLPPPSDHRRAAALDGVGGCGRVHVLVRGLRRDGIQGGAAGAPDAWVAIRSIARPWNADELISRASPAFLSAMPEDKMRLFVAFAERRLGHPEGMHTHADQAVDQPCRHGRLSRPGLRTPQTASSTRRLAR